MNRRRFLTLLGLAPLVPVVAKLPALPESKKFKTSYETAQFYSTPTEGPKPFFDLWKKALDDLLKDVEQVRFDDYLDLQAMHHEYAKLQGIPVRTPEQVAAFRKRSAAAKRGWIARRV